MILQRLLLSLENFANHKFALPIMLTIGFVLRILLLINATKFEGLNDATAMYDSLEMLRNGEKVYIYMGNYTLGVTFIAYFFEKTFGSLFGYFIFQCVVSSISLYFVYLIALHLTQTKVNAIISLTLATFYIDFAVLPIILYNQTFEIFFATSALLITFKLIDSKSNFQFVLISTLLLGFIYITFLVKATLKYYYATFFILFGYPVIQNHFKLRKLDYKFLALFLVGFYILTYPVPRNYLTKPNNNQTNNHVFFGHTDYGGLGGEGTFIFEENEERYNKALNQYFIDNNITFEGEPSQEQVNAFQSSEIKRFIREQPLSWVLLQFRKVIYSYGAVPVRDSILLLQTGKVNLGLPIIALLTQLTFAIPFLLFFLFFNFKRVRELVKDSKAVVITFFLLYTLAATTIYGHYQERYRILVMVSALIPLVGYFYDPQYLKSLFQSRKLMLLKGSVFLLIGVIWAYQIYEVFWIYGDRYGKFMN